MTADTDTPAEQSGGDTERRKKTDHREQNLQPGAVKSIH